LTLAIAFVTVVVGAATVGDYFRIGRRTLSPIPVSIDACPYLRPIHDASVHLNDQWTRALDGRLPWPSFRADLRAELPKLEGALKRAESHVPRPIVSKFDVVIVWVHLGRAQLPRATSAFDVLSPPGQTKSPVTEGVDALADASDLVGNVCGFRLAPSNPLAP
jgi:hypothetical protein